MSAPAPARAVAIALLLLLAVARHVHASPAVVPAHDRLVRLALILPGPDSGPAIHVLTGQRPLFVPPRR